MKNSPFDDDDPEVTTEAEATAQPRAFEQDLIGGRHPDPDLSIDPDDLGRHFLAEAVDQGDFSPSEVGLIHELAIGGPSESDEVTDRMYEGADTLWEASLNRDPSMVAQSPRALLELERAEVAVPVPVHEVATRPRRRALAALAILVSFLGAGLAWHLRRSPRAAM